MIKTICCFGLLIFSLGPVFAQETIDQRVVKNRGQQGEESFKYNKNSYNYYLFELDKSHWLTTELALSIEDKALLQPASEFKNSENNPLTLEAVQSENFNFYEYGIRLKKESRVCILFEDGQVLVFYAIPELTKLFTTSDSNTK